MHRQGSNLQRNDLESYASEIGYKHELFGKCASIEKS